MIRAVLVFCYGNYDYDLRSDEELRGYTEYLGGALGVIEEVDPTTVVFCGGRTNRWANESEAASVARFMGHLIDPGIEVLLEETSRNSAQNLVRGLDVLMGYYLGDDTPVDEIVVVCDWYRGPKVRALALRLDPVTVKPVWRPDPHPHSSWRFQLPAAARYLVGPLPRLLARG